MEIIKTQNYSLYNFTNLENGIQVKYKNIEIKYAKRKLFQLC